MIKKYDLIIAGYGFIGLTLASLLAKKIKILIIDQDNNQQKEASRLFAISSGSMEIFKQANIADTLKKNSRAIEKIFVNDQLNRMELSFDPKEVEEKNFGYMVEESVIKKALTAVTANDIDISNTNIINIEQNANEVLLTTDSGEFSTSLFVIAEGKNSKSRTVMNFETCAIDYKQHALVFEIEHKLQHKGLAVEEFLPSGSLALLPKYNEYRSCVVWTMPKDFEIIKATELEQLLQVASNNVLGKITIKSTIKSFELKLIYSKKYGKNRILLAGDTLHSIHPIAGQGMNLGLRDVSVINSLVEKRISLGLDIGSLEIDKDYFIKRNFDINLMINSTNIINNIFCSRDFLSSSIRKLGIKCIKNIPYIKRKIINYAEGKLY